MVFKIYSRAAEHNTCVLKKIEVIRLTAYFHGYLRLLRLKPSLAIHLYHDQTYSPLNQLIHQDRRVKILVMLLVSLVLEWIFIILN